MDTPGPISFIFMQFSARILSNNRFSATTQGLAPPPLRLGNPGSGAELSGNKFSSHHSQLKNYYLRNKIMPRKTDFCVCKIIGVSNLPGEVTTWHQLTLKFTADKFSAS